MDAQQALAEHQLVEGQFDTAAAKFDVMRRALDNEARFSTDEKIVQLAALIAAIGDMVKVLPTYIASTQTMAVYAIVAQMKKERQDG